MDVSSIFKDKDVSEELLDRIEELVPDGIRDAGSGLESTANLKDSAKRFVEGSAPPANSLAAMAFEAIVLRFGRPAYFVQNKDFVINIEDPATDEDPQTSKAVAKKSAEARGLLKPSIPQIGRIDLSNNRASWAGTGWVIGEDLVITNRHVARVFATGSQKDAKFQKNWQGRSTRAELDFRHEHLIDEDDILRVEEILWIEPDGPGYQDAALLRVKGVGTTDRPAIELMTEAEFNRLQAGDWISVIGYPAQSPYNSGRDQQRIFGGVFDVKRFQPGKIVAVDTGTGTMNHDCTTLGGNSGSAVLSMESGKAVALHFGGIEGKTNYAVTAPAVRQVLARWKGEKPRPVAILSESKTARKADSGTINVQVAAGSSGTVSIEVPLQINIQLPASGVVAAASAATESLERTTSASDYADRKGYDPDFLSETIPLPDITGAVQRFGEASINSQTKKPELPYTHFSVVMCKPRRLAFFTACNLDGNSIGKPKKKKAGWALDPRIPSEEQADNRLYTDEPGDYFQRGHLVRRLDPVWGNAKTRQQANNDTFHWTNCSPQHRSLNQGHDWSSIEDRILFSSDDADLLASVFTGPIFEDDDEEHRGVKIPKAFFKVVVHETPEGDLAAAGWVVRQDRFATNIAFETVTPTSDFPVTPTPIAKIEKMTGLDFGEVVRRVDVAKEDDIEPDDLDDAMPFDVCLTRDVGGIRLSDVDVHRPVSSLQEGVADTSLKWDNGQTIRVKFLNGSDYLRALVEETAKTWEEHANITFDFGDHADGGDIRISFNVRNRNGDPDGYWSVVGTTARQVSRSAPTMSLSNNWSEASVEPNLARVRGTILHEFGHALGLLHEHQSPNATIRWNRPLVYFYYRWTQGWTWADIRQQVLDRDTGPNIQATSHDPKSIMQYPVDPRLTLDFQGIGENNELSDTDKAFIGRLYPKP